MLSRRLTSTLVGAAAVGLLATTGCSEQAAAIRVGDQRVSQSDFMDEVDDLFDYLVENEAFAEGSEPVGELVDSYDQQFVGEVVSDRVSYMLTVELFESQGLELTDAALSDARRQLEPQAGFADLPSWYQDQLVETDAMTAVLTGALPPEDLQQASTDLLETVDVHVNPKYGRWDPDAFATGQPAVLASDDGPLVETAGEDGGSVLPGSPEE